LGEIAEIESHHPDILLSWGRVLVTIFTHKVDGLTESDFILAAKYEQCWEVWSETPARTT
jgi:4a-hydroxytetrahydrobiopterin dehydratase